MRNAMTDSSQTGWKSLFHVPPGGPYGLAHSVGCLPRSVRNEIETALLTPWQERGGDAWSHWIEAIGAFRSALVDLFGGDTAQWCPQPGVSAAIAKIIGGLKPPGGRNVILLSEHAFPSVAYALGGLSRLGFRVELVSGDPSQQATWARLRDPDIAAVVLMHVHSNNALVSPVEELAAIARTQGVVSIVDIAQSAGVLPLSVEHLGVDAAVGSSVKWLGGGPGAAFAWIAPDITRRIEPVERGWFSHGDPFAMDIHHFDFAPDARRLWGGTPSVAPFVIATAGLRTIAGIGVPAIRAHNLRLSAKLLERLAGRLGDPERLPKLGGTLCLPLTTDQEATLRDAGVRCDRRGDRVRLSFGAWNDEADVDQVADALRSLDTRTGDGR